MIFLYSWLKDFVSLPESAQELSEKLTMSGVEVESVVGATETITKVLTARILKIEKHPNADRLKLCEVTDGEATHSVVCGADNMREGDSVLLALPGARLKGGLKIKKSKIRGVESGGMLCSEVELGIADESEGIMILTDSPEPGIDINDYIPMNRTLLDIGITPNRPDLYSVVGLAREIGAITGGEFKEPDFSFEETGPAIEDFLKVTVASPELCPRYAARVISKVKVSDSPDWLKRRLEARSIRPINNIVDATNYVLIELGQPLHAFDHAKLGGGELIVRTSNKGEVITTLDDKERKLIEGTLLICDKVGPQAIAGIMGGAGSEVTEATETIVLESAWFEPTAVRRRSRELGLSTESSFIFERGIDIENTSRALDRAALLITEIAGGVISRGHVDIYNRVKQERTVSFSVESANALLGSSINEQEARDIFESLDMEVSRGVSPGEFFVTPPTYRGDVVDEIDLIEEVARMRGYDDIQATLPEAGLKLATTTKEYDLKKRVKEILVTCGFFEVLNYSFVSAESYATVKDDLNEAIQLVNPLSVEQSVMRGSLLPSLIENLQSNLSQKNEDLLIFEVAPVFALEADKRSENWRASGLMYGNASLHEKVWNRAEEGLDLYGVKGVVETCLEGLGMDTDTLEVSSVTGPLFHPARAGAYKIEGKELARFAEIHPRIADDLGLKESAFLFELDMGAIVDIFSNIKKFAALARYPESTRDIAFVVDENIDYLKIYNSIKVLDRKVVEKVELFDVYYDKDFQKGKRSLALRITYRSKERTLKFEEIDEVHSRVIKELESMFNAEIRI